MPGRKPGTKNEYSSATISRDIRESIHAALQFDGGPVRFWRQLKLKKPDVFAHCVIKALVRNDESPLMGLNLVVQQLIVADARPIPGVLQSPVQQHVEHKPHLVANGGELVQEVLDLEVSDGP